MPEGTACQQFRRIEVKPDLHPVHGQSQAGAEGGETQPESARGVEGEQHENYGRNEAHGPVTGGIAFFGFGCHSQRRKNKEKPEACKQKFQAFHWCCRQAENVSLQ